MTQTKLAHPSVEERQARGRAAREATPPASHATWVPAADRPDPVALLEEQNATREPDLVPVRHGRMMVSPFTFYRGAAKIMAADLEDTPTAGPERPAVRRRAPVELRRVRLARAQAGVRPQRLRRDPARAVRVRREADGGELHDRGPQQRVHQGGHARRDAGVGDAPTGRRWPSSRRWARWTSGTPTWPRTTLMAAVARRRSTEHARNGQGEEAGEGQARSRRSAAKKAQNGGEPARRRTPATACRRCPSSASWSTAGTGSSASRRSSSRCGTWPPPTACPPTRSSKRSTSSSAPTGRRLQDDRRHLLERFEIVDVARKVVGVGSVGTRAFIVLLQGRDAAGPAVPAGQGGHRVGAGGSPAEEPLSAARRAGGAGAADDAGRQRHLPGLDEGRGGQPASSTGASCAT